jgi:hypothetical protein
MKTYRGVDVQIHVFLTSALVGGEWTASHRGCFIPEERAPCTHWIGDWVGLKAGLDAAEERTFLILLGLELRTLGHPARSQSLYRLSYPESNINAVHKFPHKNDRLVSVLLVYFKFSSITLQSVFILFVCDPADHSGRAV